MAVESSALHGSPIVRRYRDAYRVASAVIALGTMIKVMGAIAAILLAFISLQASSGPFGSTAAVLGGFLLAAVLGAFFWVCGVVVASQGQVLLATLDVAVSSSHFLTDPERADAMGLPRSTIGHPP